MSVALQIEDLSKHYDGIVAVDNVNFAIKLKTITGIFGENGAGKTTFFNLISGYEMPDKKRIRLNLRFIELPVYTPVSSIKIFDKNADLLTVRERCLLGLGRLFQKPRVFNELTVIENLLMSNKPIKKNSLLVFLFKYRVVKRAKIINSIKAVKLLKEFSLYSKKDDKAFKLSFGERKLLSLCCLMMNNSKLVLLDEPFAGINTIKKLINLIKHYKNKGVAFLIIEHKYNILADLCDYIYEMKSGKINLSHINRLTSY